MMKKLVPWAIAFAAQLFAARSAAESGVDPISGRPVQVIPANMWPPHRPRPPQPTHRKSRDDKGKRIPVDRVRMAVIDGRVSFGERTKLVGGKGLRP